MKMDNKNELIKMIKMAYVNDNKVFKYFGVILSNGNSIKTAFQVWNIHQVEMEELIEYYDRFYDDNLEQIDGSGFRLRIIYADTTNCIDDFKYEFENKNS